MISLFLMAILIIDDAPIIEERKIISHVILNSSINVIASTEDTQHPLNQSIGGQPNHDPPTNYIGLRPLPRHSGWRMEYT